MRTTHHRLLSVLAVPVLATSLGACGTPAASPSPGVTDEVTQAAPKSPSSPATATADEQAPERKTATPSATPEDPSAGTALAQLETITIKGRAPKTGYDRDKFGYGWTDIDHNGCDTRIICTTSGNHEGTVGASAGVSELLAVQGTFDTDIHVKGYEGTRSEVSEMSL